MPKLWILYSIVSICYLHKLVVVSVERALVSYLSDNSNHLKLFIEKQSEQSFGIRASINPRLNN